MFKHSCFIRKNTPELRKKLEELGYMLTESVKPKENTVLYANSVGYGYVSGCHEYNIPYMLSYSDVIDCSDNESLFLAIAAVRDDSDYMQWFTDGKEWILCDREDWEDMHSTLCCGGNYNYNKNGELDKFHKATLEEIINHFK